MPSRERFMMVVGKKGQSNMCCWTVGFSEYDKFWMRCEVCRLKDCE